MASIRLEGVSKVYPNGFNAVRGLDLSIDDGELLVVVGPSGCGKTTVLRMIAGLETVSSGSVLIDDEVVNDVAPRDRDIAMVFQSYALYPNMNVAQNIGFALKMRGLTKNEIAERVRSAAAVLGITNWLDRRPGQLSGGQRQRVAMGRAIVREPKAFLMDEPLSNLDAKLRVQMRTEIARVQRRIGVATVYVTHDQTEAMTLGHRVAVLRDGVLQQCDAPQVLYNRPANVFVAGFIGSPAMNLLRGRLEQDVSHVSVGSQRVSLAGLADAQRAALLRIAGREVVVGLRPEQLLLQAGAQCDAALDAEVQLVEALGSEYLIHFGLDAEGVGTDLVGEEADENLVDGSRERAFVARVAPTFAPKIGERLSLHFDSRRLEFFDADSGVAIREESTVATG
jgi:multiple sugar transport system ATP-binding protein